MSNGEEARSATVQIDKPWAQHPIRTLHACVETLASAFKGFLPWADEHRGTTVRGHEMLIEDTLKRADACMTIIEHASRTRSETKAIYTKEDAEKMCELAVAAYKHSLALPKKCDKCGTTWTAPVEACPQCPSAPAQGETKILDGLEDFVQEGCSARPEDKHHALQAIESIRAALSAPSQCGAPVVWQVANRTFSALFSSKEEAEGYVSRLGASVGMTISERAVIGTSSSKGRS